MKIRVYVMLTCCLPVLTREMSNYVSPRHMEPFSLSDQEVYIRTWDMGETYCLINLVFLVPNYAISPSLGIVVAFLAN